LKLLSAILVCFIALVLYLSLRGCHESAPNATKQAQQQKFRQFDQDEALLKATAAQLRDLPGAVDTELRPPVVLLDSRKSGDGKDVLAICTANPKGAADVFNVIHVPTGNSRFRSLGVKSGDILKYYVKEDETVDADSRNAGYSRQLAMDLNVAQVIDDSTLLVETGLNQPVSPARKIEVWRYVDDRLQEIHQHLNDYEVYRHPAIAWEPAPDDQVLTQVMAWLNQWIRQSDPKTDWQRDSLIDTLDASLRSDAELAKLIAPEALAARAFQPEDGRHIQEAIWIRDISNWAHGEGFNDVDRATAIFDWTVRNIQLEPDDDPVPRRPWQTLLYGRGTAEQRAWVFARLGRQLGLDVVILSIPATAASDGKSAPKTAPAKFWLPALFSEGQLYLFDTRLALPVPGPDGKGVATLEQVRKDDSLLRKLDIDGAKYPVTAESLKSVEIDLVATPFSLSRRANQMEANLSGDDRLTLAAKPSELAGRLKSIPGVSAIRLWNFPFQTLSEQLSWGKSARHRDALEFEPFAMRPGLWKGRTRHFQGKHEEALGDNLDRKSKDNKKTSDGYLSKSVRPTGKEIAESSSVDKRRVDTISKLSAAYWVGLMSFDDGKFAVAQSWLGRPELTAAGSPWAFGAAYNLARALESLGKYDQAIAILEKDASPQAHGNKLRARALKFAPKPAKVDE
jgi:transglutaminase-like putative cysteine protease